MCVCCGRYGYAAIHVGDDRFMHIDCWNEHHSDPTGPWPRDHICARPRKESQ